MGFRAVIRAGITGRQTSSPDIGTASYDFDDSVSIALSLGTAAGEATHVFTDVRTIAASGTETLDLAGGLTGPLGVPLTFSALKALKIQASPSNSNAIVIGGGSNAFRGWFADASDKIALPPGGVLLLGDPTAAGQPVTPGTGDLLLIANSAGGTPVTYTISLVGEA